MVALSTTAAKRGLAVALAAGGALAAACSRDPRVEDRSIVVYASRWCPVSQERAYSVVYGAGDFDAPGDALPVASLYLRDVGTIMTALPSATRSIIVDVSQPPSSGSWRGVSAVPPSGPVSVLVWPTTESCALSRNVERRKSGTFGVFGRHVMIAGGTSAEDGGQTPATYVGDLTTGIVDRLALGLAARRAEATVTAFRTAEGEDPSPALVAGGEDPEGGRPLATAEIYLPDPSRPGALGDFTRATIPLSKPRTRHGAVVLASGETLLVGGRSDGGVLRSTELVDPKTRAARIERLADLEFARERPIVLRLASGEILVAGGEDDQGDPVPVLEWLSAEGLRSNKRAQPLVAGRARACVALDGGGALAVIAPVEPTPDFPTVWVISAAGVPERARAVDPAELTTVRLYPGADGAPLLWTGSRWLRWQPWFGAFQPITDAPPDGPSNLDPAPDAVASGDSGLALWLADRAEAGGYVTGYRFAARTEFDAPPKTPALLVDGPDGLAPDRLAGVPGSQLGWSPEVGLELGASASAFVADLTFGDFDAELEVSGAAPLVVLRTTAGRELEVGGAECAGAQTAERRLVITRRGGTVRYAADDREPRACPTGLASSSARVALGLRGVPGPRSSAARNLRITRR